MKTAKKTPPKLEALEIRPAPRKLTPSQRAYLRKRYGYRKITKT